MTNEVKMKLVLFIANHALPKCILYTTYILTYN